MTALLLAIALGAKAEDVAQVIWCAGNKTLYFTYEELKAVGDTYEGQTITSVWSGTAVTESGASPGWVDDTYDNGSEPYDICTAVVFKESFKNVRPASCLEWFSGLSMEAITGLAYLNTSEVTNMKSMFASCSNLKSLDLSKFNTSKVTSMQTMFLNCSKLTSLDLTSFDTSQVTDMVRMFDGCSGLTTLSFSSGWTKANKVTSWTNMFRSCSASLLINCVLDGTDADIDATVAMKIATSSGKKHNVTLLRKMTARKKQTLCLPFVPTGLLSKGKVWKFSGTDAGKIVMTQIDSEATLSANTPYIFEPTDDGTQIAFANVLLDYPASQPMTESDNTHVEYTFYGTLAPGVWEAGHEDVTKGYLYGFLAKDNAGRSEGQFAQAKRKTYINAFSAYLKYTGDSSNIDPQPATARSRRAAENLPETIDIIWRSASDETSILNIRTGEMTDGYWYTIDGRHLQGQPTQKGVYIHDGRKVVIK